jgi:hypothetical protein
MTRENAFVHAPPGRTGPLAYRGRDVTTEEGWRQCMDDVLQFLLAVPVPAIGSEANP